MRYLFFDIECADGNFKICEFGYASSRRTFLFAIEIGILLR